MIIRNVQPLNKSMADRKASLAVLMLPLIVSLGSANFGDVCFSGYSENAHGVLSCCSFGLTLVCEATNVVAPKRRIDPPRSNTLYKSSPLIFYTENIQGKASSRQVCEEYSVDPRSEKGPTSLTDLSNLVLVYHSNVRDLESICAEPRTGSRDHGSPQSRAR